MAFSLLWCGFHPGPGTSICHRKGQKQTNKQTNKKQKHSARNKKSLKKKKKNNDHYI